MVDINRRGTYPYPFDADNLLGQFIRQRRTDLNMTQVELSALTGIGQGNISDLERGRISLPSVALRRKIADALNVAHVDLLVAAGEVSEEEIRQSGTTTSIPPVGSAKRELMTFVNDLPDEMVQMLMLVCRGIVDQSRRHGITPADIASGLSSRPGVGND